MPVAMKPKIKHVWLGVAFALTVAATLAVGDPPKDSRVAEPILRTTTPSAAREAAKSAEPKQTLRLPEFRRPAMEMTDANPFAPKSWYTPPPLPPPQESKPVPPPLPFSYKGKLEESDGRQLFYLAKGDESFVVAAGDTFGGSYKLEAARTDALVIRYLPLSATQILRYGPEL